jgi:hypothetical protein
MPDSIYDVIELVGTSTESWEKAAKAADILGLSVIWRTEMRSRADESESVPC